MPAIVAPPGQLVNLQPALTVNTGNGQAIACAARVKNHTIFITGSGTISGGTVTIEEAADPTFAGGWQTVTTAINATNATAGAIIVTHFTQSSIALRARVSAAITGGGSIQVDYRGETD